MESRDGGRGLFRGARISTGSWEGPGTSSAVRGTRLCFIHDSTDTSRPSLTGVGSFILCSCSSSSRAVKEMYCVNRLISFSVAATGNKE